MQIDPQRDTLVSIFCRRAEADGACVALRFHDGGQWSAVTWSQLHDEVRRESFRLRDRLGVVPGDRVVLMSKNSPAWIVHDLAIQMARGVHVPLHATLTGPQLAEQIRHCSPRVVLVEDAEQLGKIRDSIDDLTRRGDTRVVVIGTGDHRPRTIDRTDPTDLSHRTNRTDAQLASIEQEALHELTPDDLATILYTSGTTGEPKGVMLTQANLVSNTAASLDAFAIGSDDLRLSFLPWSHIFARTCDLYTWIASGAELAIAESREKIFDNCAELRPTLINAVPYFWDKVYQTLAERDALTTPGSVDELLGGRIRLCVSGGAALPDHIAELFERQQVDLVQGYGLTETSPVISTCRPEQNKIGTVGPPVDGVEVRIADDGEILTRGPHVMRGYYKNPEATAEAIRDGWFHTGDLGELDADGFLRITGRKKEIIVLATGKNIAPALVEGLLTQDSLILQAFVCGSERKYLTALIVPNPDALRDEIKRRKIAILSRGQALANRRVQELYRERIETCLARLSASEQIRAFRLLDRGFTIESGEMTPTMKLRRDAIMSNFSDVIESMYESS